MHRGGPSSRALAANCDCDCGYNPQILLVGDDGDEEDCGGDPQMPLVDDDEDEGYWIKCRCVHCGQGNGCNILIASIMVLISDGLCESCRGHTGLMGLHLLAWAQDAGAAATSEQGAQGAPSSSGTASSSEPGAPAAAAATAVSQLAGVVHDSSEGDDEEDSKG